MQPERPRTPLARPALLAAVLALAALGLAGSAGGQILGGGLPGLPLPAGAPTGLPGRELAGPVLDQVRTLADQRLERLSILLRDHRDQVEADEHGNPVVRGEVIALSPDADTLKRAEAAGFRVQSRANLADLGIEIVTLSTPPGLSARTALKRLRAIEPSGRFELDHLFESSGGTGPAIAAAQTRGGAPGDGVRVGMIDTGVAASHPSLAAAHVEQQLFAPGALSPREHGTAVASLLVGQAPPFRGAAPGARLYAADVFGSGPVGGAGVSIARALAWMAGQKVGVINVSLTGPDDLTLRTVVSAMTARGFLIVAAAGNDGPAAPPAFPASYPGVIAVTAVDGRGRVLPEAGRPRHLDFAAPGSDMAAADLSGWTTVRGTSFATPLVAGRLALALSAPDPSAATRARAALAASGRAIAVGASAHPVLVSETLRIAPATLRR